MHFFFIPKILYFTNYYQLYLIFFLSPQTLALQPWQTEEHQAAQQVAVANAVDSAADLAAVVAAADLADVEVHVDVAGRRRRTNGYR
jgi:hypothetical protein